MQGIFREWWLRWRYGADFPQMTRLSYQREMWMTLSYSMPFLLMEAGLLSKFAQVMFGASTLQQSLIAGAPLYMNMTGVLWARWSHGRSKAKFIAWLYVGLAVILAMIALLPPTQAMSWWLVGLTLLGRSLISGIMAVRSHIWRYNYNRDMRARITARLTMIQNGVFMLAPLPVAALLDLDPRMMLLLYLLGGGLSALSSWVVRGLRLRQEKGVLNTEREERDEKQRHGFMAMFQVLKQDHRFRTYMIYQYLAGVSNMVATIAVFLYINDITQMGEQYHALNDQILIAAILSTVLPELVIVASLPFWGRMLDKMHVTRFRTVQGPVWVAWQLIAMLGVLIIMHRASGETLHTAEGRMWFWIALTVMGMGMLARGAAFGAGRLAWNLGHNDFSKRSDTGLYMGIHLMLTGTRGLWTPMFAWLMFMGWSSQTWVLGEMKISIPGVTGLGPYTFALTAVLAALATLGFYGMAREDDQVDQKDG